MKELYHFTNLINLPAVLSEGISRGEIPIGPNVPYRHRPQAPNLTRVPLPSHQRCWNFGATDKTRVRLTLSLPPSMVVTFEEIRRRYRIRTKWVKALAPKNEHFDWFFASRSVEPEQIRKVEVALHNPGEYTLMSGERLGKLVRAIKAEFERLSLKQDGQVLRFGKQDWDHRSFLLDGGDWPYDPAPIGVGNVQ